MRPRPVDDIPDDLPLDRGVTYARAAEALGCDTSTVYKLVKEGLLTAWRVKARPGARGGPRISVASIEAYKAGTRIVPDPERRSPAAPPAPSHGRALTGAHRAAMARLKEFGIV